MRRINLILCCLIFLISCNNDKKVDYNLIFTPPFEINRENLIQEGFNKVDSLGEINKVIDDALVSYLYLNDNDPIYARQVVKLGIDSADVDQWIEKNQAIVLTDWEKLNGKDKKYRFYIQDTKSALIMPVKFSNNNLVITFIYPDVGSSIRSDKRKINTDGTIQINGTDYKNNKVSHVIE